MLCPWAWTLQLGTKGGVPREPSPSCRGTPHIMNPEMGNSIFSVEVSRLMGSGLSHLGK